MPKLAGANERTFFDEVGEIAGGCSRRCPRDRDVVPRTEATFEATGAFLEHAQESLLLPCVDLAMQAIEVFPTQKSVANLCFGGRIRASGEDRWATIGSGR